MSPTTHNPSSAGPTSRSPITLVPSASPTSTSPITAAPSHNPTTLHPATAQPGTTHPVSAAPSSAPTSGAPLTAAPSHAPATNHPHTLNPTASPQSVSPTTTTLSPTGSPSFNECEKGINIGYGAVGENCNDVCNGMGLECSNEALHCLTTLTYTSEKITSVFASLGLTCTNTQAIYQTSTDNPNIYPNGNCIYPTLNRDLTQYDCARLPSGNPYGKRRLCNCQIPVTSGPTSAPSAVPTAAPTSKSPLTAQPSTNPTTHHPATTHPGTSQPVSFAPSSAPTSKSPTTAKPTSAPNTLSPHTIAPATFTPTRSPLTTNPATLTPTSNPTSSTATPTRNPTKYPSNSPVSASPSLVPTSDSPATATPSAAPTTQHPATTQPGTTHPFSAAPSPSPTSASPLTAQPSGAPTSNIPTPTPTRSPTTNSPVSGQPTLPTQSPSSVPSVSPTTAAPADLTVFIPTNRDTTEAPTTQSSAGGTASTAETLLALAIGLPVGLALLACCAYFLFFRKKSKWECKRCGEIQGPDVLNIRNKNFKCANCGFQSEFWSEHSILRKAGQKRKLKPHACVNCSKRFMLTVKEYNSNMFFKCDACESEGRTKTVLHDCYETKQVNVDDVVMVRNTDKSYDAVDVGSMAGTHQNFDRKTMNNLAISMADSEKGSITSLKEPTVEGQIGRRVGHSRKTSLNMTSGPQTGRSMVHTGRSELDPDNISSRLDNDLKVMEGGGAGPYGV